MPRQYSQYYLRKKSLKPIGFYKKKVKGKRKKVTVPIMPRVARRRVHVASVLPPRKPSIIKRKTVLPRDVMEERIISISRTHLGPMAQQNLQDNLRKANDEKVEELYKYWSKQGKKKKEPTTIKKTEQLTPTQIEVRKEILRKIHDTQEVGQHLSKDAVIDQVSSHKHSNTLVKEEYEALEEEGKIKREKRVAIPSKPKRQPAQKMTHIERMHLLAACKKFELDPQEIDNTLNYYENKKHLQELASEKGFSEAEITSAEQEQKEWTSQYETYLNQLKGELKSAGYQVIEPATL